ncbi:MAG: hypothetical protein U1F61_20275 [Opitutaceae bacterium]
MTSNLSRSQGIQIGIITGVAIALYVTLRLLPTGTNLNHMDFRVQGGNSIEFCDPSNPQFIPVVAVRSPVTMTVQPESAAVAGEVVRVVIRLTTSTGKPMGPDDLIVAHTRKLHILIVDPTLRDYQHVHPEPTRAPGEWRVSFRPRAGGIYRLFADFTPVATRRGLYASADLPIAGVAFAPEAMASPVLQQDREGIRFRLTPSARPVRAGVTADLTFAMEDTLGGEVRLSPVMDAYAHLVAFDEKRGGFAHLHPLDLEVGKTPDRHRPTLGFKVTIPEPGRYVIWAQVAVNGTEVFIPFWFTVTR